MIVVDAQQGHGTLVKAMCTHPNNSATMAFARKSVMSPASFPKMHIEREIELLKKLDYHNIVSFVGCYVQGHTIHIWLFPWTNV